MKKITAFMMIMLMSFMSGCGQLVIIKDTAIEKAVETGTKIIEVGATCSHPEAIEKDLYEEIEGLAFLKYSRTMDKTLVGDLCVTAFSGVIPKFVDYGTGKLPARWGCTGNDIKKITVKFSETICAKI